MHVFNQRLVVLIDKHHKHFPCIFVTGDARHEECREKSLEKKQKSSCKSVINLLIVFMQNKQKNQCNKGSISQCIGWDE